MISKCTMTSRRKISRSHAVDTSANARATIQRTAHDRRGSSLSIIVVHVPGRRLSGMIDHHVVTMTADDQDHNDFPNDRWVRDQPFGSFYTFRGVQHPVRLVDAHELRPDRSEQSLDKDDRAQG